MPCRTLILCFFIVLLFSCKTTNDNKLVKFKNYVGAENFASIDFLMKSMEDKLRHTFNAPNIDGAILKYFSNLKEGKVTLLFDESDCEALNNYKLSGMEDKWSLNRYDSIVYDEDLGTLSKYYKDYFEEEIIIGENLMVDSIEKLRKELQPLDYIHQGKLIGGLRYIAQNDSVILKYIEHREKVGDIPTERLIDALLNDRQVSFGGNYFHRMIVLTEVYMVELSSKCQ